MNEVRLEDATINYEGAWLSADDLKNRIQEKMNSGDMKFANLAAVLEELNTAIESSKTIEVKLVITKEEYDQLIERGGPDENASVKKAISAFIGGDTAPAPAVAAQVTAPEPPADTIQTEGAGIPNHCPKCNAPIEVSSDDQQVSFECPECGTSSRLKLKHK